MSNLASTTSRKFSVPFLKAWRSRRSGLSLRQLREYEQKATSLQNQELKSRASAIRDLALDDKVSQALRGEYIGLVCEAVFRTNGFRLFDVQLLAATSATLGQIVEMQTGEGKTVVTGVIAAAQTLSAPSVHVGTTNQYLAARDMEDNAEMFDLLGISFGLLPEESDKEESTRVYRRQIVYGPGYQYGFDYLHDQMDMRKDRSRGMGRQIANRIRGLTPITQTIQLPHHHIALIDEADSVMIDEAMTPLVISLPARDQSPDPEPYLLAKTISRDLVEGEDYQITMPGKIIEVNDKANQRTHDLIARHRTLQLLRPWRTYISNAIRADKVMQRDVDYVVLDSKTKVVTTVGWSRERVGKIINPEKGGVIPEKGDRVEAYVKKQGDHYTLYGSEDYYIKVISSE